MDGVTYWRLFYHVIWGTKNWLPVIDADREAVLRRALPGMARQDEALVHAIGIMPDHVHVVLSIPPKVAIASVVNRLKGSSSHLLGHDGQAADSEAWPGWQAEYGVLSFAESNLKSLVDYAVHQREHHAQRDLRDKLERWS
jgi:putative transposase